VPAREATSTQAARRSQLHNCSGWYYNPIQSNHFFVSSFAAYHYAMAITQCQRQKQIVLLCFQESLSLLVLVD
jgi:hypothetical protein